jgi:ADP-heptose:LPS heptosyltransferase
MDSNRKHIMVIRLSSMGDVAMTVPVLKLLLEQHPELRLTIVSRPKFAPLFDNLPNCIFFSADVDNTYKGLTGLYRLSIELTALKPDYIADLHEVLRTNLLGLLLKLRIKTVLVKINKGRKEKKKLCAENPNKERYPLKSTFQRYADVFNKLGFYTDLNAAYSFPIPELSAKSKLLLSESDSKIAIGIAAFARYDWKTYPENQMLETISILLKKKSDVHIFLFGGQADRDKFIAWKELFGGCISVVSELSFSEELSLIARMKLMLSMDSANMHLASIYSVPVVSLWGPTHPFFGFYGWRQNPENALCADLERYPTLPCSVNGSKIHKGTEDCMSSISPEIIAAKIINNLL